MPLKADANAWMMRAFRWLEQHHDRVAASPDPIVREALAVASWDACLIAVKLLRALDGRDRARYDEAVDDHPVQNDWNGSAKVALISIERSVPAWQLIGHAYGDDGARAIAEELVRLRRAALGEFPDAMAFVRPGFDEPWRREE